MARGGALIPLLAVAACVSYSYTDDRNVQHVIGFVDVAVAPPATSPGSTTPSAVKVTSIGLSAYSNPETGGGLILGYSQLTFLALPNNSCVDLQAAGPCSSVQSPSNKTVIGMNQP